MRRRIFFGLVGLPVVAAAVVAVTQAGAQTAPTPPRDSLPTVPVTVTVTSVTRINGGDIGSDPDYFTRINIDGTWFQSGRIDDSAAITPGWSFTRNVSRNGGFVPIRIEIKDYDGSAIPPEDVDVDPSVCPPSLVIGDGCATITIGRPPVDFKGIDISFNPATGAVTPSDSTGDASSTTACTTGTETAPLGLGSTATMCFTITVGPPNPIVVTKTADFDPAVDDGFCTRTDCSLREALWAAQDGDTIELRALGHPYRLTYEKRDLADVQLDEPGHLKIERPNLTITGPASGAGVVVEQTLQNVRVFDVHGGGSVTMRNITIRGGSAGDNSTAVRGHKHGGGIHNHGIVQLVNVTLTGNHAPLDDPIGGGGAIWNAGTMTLKHVTIAGNDAARFAGGLSGATATVTNSLIANNLGPDGPDGDSNPDPVNCTGTHTDGGGNTQFPGTTCGFAGPTLASSPIGALAPDFTYWLNPGSKAIDRTNANCEPDDQAGTPRPLDGNGDGVTGCDSGATEYDPEGLGVIHQPLNSATGQPGPVTMTFDNVTTAGTSTLTISTTGPGRPAGYRAGTPSLYYDLATAASFTGGVKVCIDYTGTSFGNEAGLRLFHHTGGSWQDKTVSLDTAANEICGRTSSFSVFAVFGANRAPVASIAEPAGGYRLNEGGSVVLRGSGTDADGDPLTYLWSPATELDDPTKAQPTFSPRDDGTRVYTLTVHDGDTASTPVPTTVRVDNVAPTVRLTGPADGTLYRVGSAVQIGATFTDPGVDDVHTCKVDWDDGTPLQSGNVTETNGSGSCAAMRTFTSAGVYTLVLTVDDGDGGVTSVSTMVVVYDPSAGRVAGSGSISSPAGAYRPSPGATGSVTFSFAAHYFNGASVPLGSVAAMLPAGAQFTSTSVQWLVVTGFKSQFRGVGRINGVGDYGFLLTAYDGQQPGGGGTDRFRLKIWNRAGGALVYDNVLDPTATDDVDRAKPQAVGFGSVITIFKL